MAYVYSEDLSSLMLDAASENDHEALLRLFQEARLDQRLLECVNSKDYLGFTPLCMAASHGCFESLRLLMENGAKANLRGNIRRTPLMYAACNGHIECVDYLLEHGADVDLQDEVGYSALMYASDQGFLPCVASLLRHVRFCCCLFDLI